MHARARHRAVKQRERVCDARATKRRIQNRKMPNKKLTQKQRRLRIVEKRKYDRERYYVEKRRKMKEKDVSQVVKESSKSVFMSIIHCERFMICADVKETIVDRTDEAVDDDDAVDRKEYDDADSDSSDTSTSEDPTYYPPQSSSTERTRNHRTCEFIYGGLTRDDE